MGSSLVLAGSEEECEDRSRIDPPIGACFAFSRQSRVDEPLDVMVYRTVAHSCERNELPDATIGILHNGGSDLATGGFGEHGNAPIVDFGEQIGGEKGATPSKFDRTDEAICFKPVHLEDGRGPEEAKFSREVAHAEPRRLLDDFEDPLPQDGRRP